jgi:hypothetical protein
MAYISDMNSSYEIDKYGVKKYVYKEKFFFSLLAIGMAVFVGLRTAGNDTYRLMYEATSSNISDISQINWTSFASAPGLQFVCICLKSIGATTQDYFMLFALFTVCTDLWFVRKYSEDIWLSVFFFITMGVYTFTMAAIKQTTAVAFLLIATDRAIEKKNVRFIIWVTIAMLFHPYSFVYLIVPLLFFKPWTKRTYFLIAGSVLVALGLSRFMGGILDMTDALGGSYDDTAFVGEGVNIFRVLVVFVPVVLSFFLKNTFTDDEENRTPYLIMNLSMVNAFVMFIGLFGTANYFARLANYFLIFQTLSLPWLLKQFVGKSKRIMLVGSLVCYFAYFYYGTVIANGVFDNEYRFTTLAEFFKQLY